MMMTRVKQLYRRKYQTQKYLHTYDPFAKIYLTSFMSLIDETNTAEVVFFSPNDILRKCIKIIIENEIVYVPMCARLVDLKWIKQNYPYFTRGCSGQ